MRKFAALPMTAAMIVILATAATASPRAMARDLPFTATMSGDEVRFNPEIPDGRCVEITEPDQITTFTGSGHASHLGRVEVTAEHCSNLATGMYGDGMLTIVASNGDVLKATYGNGVSLTPPPEIAFSDEFTFVDGGTGLSPRHQGAGPSQACSSSRPTSGLFIWRAPSPTTQPTDPADRI